MKPFLDEVFTQKKPIVLKTLFAIYILTHDVKPSFASLVDPYNQEGLIKLLQKALNKDNMTGETDGLIARIRDYKHEDVAQDKLEIIDKIMAQPDMKVNIKIFGFEYTKYSEFLYQALTHRSAASVQAKQESAKEEEKVS